MGCSRVTHIEIENKSYTIYKRTGGWRAEKIKSWITNKSPLLKKETARTALKKQVDTNQKIKDALGFNFIPMKESVEWASKKFLEEVGEKQLLHSDK